MRLPNQHTKERYTRILTCVTCSPLLVGWQPHLQFPAVLLQHQYCCLWQPWWEQLDHSITLAWKKRGISILVSDYRLHVLITTNIRSRSDQYLCRRNYNKINNNIKANIHMHLHTHTHTYGHAHSNTRTHTHMHTHTCTLLPPHTLSCMLTSTCGVSSSISAISVCLRNTACITALIPSCRNRQKQ